MSNVLSGSLVHCTVGAGCRLCHGLKAAQASCAALAFIAIAENSRDPRETAELNWCECLHTTFMATRLLFYVFL